jgi:UDP-N-acetylmuramate--alanine ligase
VLAVFQPHRYSRVRDLFGDFCRCFHRADHVVVCPIYAAGEQPLDGLDHHRVAEGLRTHGQRSVVVVEDLDEAVQHLRQEMKPGDIVITLGAGNVNRICDDLLEGSP